MTKAAQQLLSAFEKLPEDSKKEVLLRLLRVPLQASYATLSDAELCGSAEEIFLELDRRESQA